MRLIDADELREQMKELHEKRAEEANMTGDRVVCVTWHDAVIFIKNAPTIDAEPVKHGHWEIKPLWQGAEAKYCECSVCHHASWMTSDYCQHCGAKMEGVEDDKRGVE